MMLIDVYIIGTLYVIVFIKISFCFRQFLNFHAIPPFKNVNN